MSRGRDWRDAATTSRIAGSYQKLGRGKEGSGSQSLRKEHGRQTPRFWPPASRSARECVAMALRHRLCGLLLQRPQETNTHHGPGLRPPTGARTAASVTSWDPDSPGSSSSSKKLVTVSICVPIRPGAHSSHWGDGRGQGGPGCPCRKLSLQGGVEPPLRGGLCQDPVYPQGFPCKQRHLQMDLDEPGVTAGYTEGNSGTETGSRSPVHTAEQQQDAWARGQM